MENNLLKRQLLIDGDDKCLYIIFESSVIVDPKIKRLKEGDYVTLKWPESAKSPIHYRGKILKFSSNYYTSIFLKNNI